MKMHKARQQRLAKDVLCRWAAAVAERQRLRALVAKALDQAVQRRCVAVIQAWQEAVWHARRTRAILSKMLHRYVVGPAYLPLSWLYLNSTSS